MKTSTLLFLVEEHNDTLTEAFEGQNEQGRLTSDKVWVLSIAIVELCLWLLDNNGFVLFLNSINRRFSILFDERIAIISLLPLRSYG